MRRLRVFIGIPEEFNRRESVSLAKEPSGAFSTLEKICENLGWKSKK
jgi:hypothetical protein